MCQDTIQEDYTGKPLDASLFPDMCDAHCHPHDAIDKLDLIPQLKTGHITIMGVRQDDWDCVESVAKACNQVSPKKCIPCYGIHPWFTYRTMTEEGSKDSHYESALKCPNPDEKKELVSLLEPPFPFDVWHTNLYNRLVADPSALVGEVGLDRSASLMPGGSIVWQGVRQTSVQVTIEHQLAILETQLKLARQLNRAVSTHCVQSQGHLLSLLHKTYKKGDKSSVRLCIHSFGGSPGTIPQFMSVRGYKIYVSFSMAINSRLPPVKLNELIKAIPDDRILLESDVNDPDSLDDSLVAIAHKVGTAKGWTIEKVVQQTHSNWTEFVTNPPPPTFTETIISYNVSELDDSNRFYSNLQ
ncbi:TatD family [Phycomyces nitens]|nr:TatD family [Phycomyces nitens]